MPLPLSCILAILSHCMSNKPGALPASPETYVTNSLLNHLLHSIFPPPAYSLMMSCALQTIPHRLAAVQSSDYKSWSTADKRQMEHWFQSVDEIDVQISTTSKLPPGRIECSSNSCLPVVCRLHARLSQEWGMHETLASRATLQLRDPLLSF